MTVGIVGLGLMGASVAAAMSLFGYRVVGISPVESEVDRTAKRRMRKQIEDVVGRKLVPGTVEHYLDQIRISNDFQDLSACDMVIENVLENLEVKKDILEKIEAVVKDDTIIGTNTSAIPINTLQKFLKKRDRFLGLHWSDPAFTSQFLEIICGDESDQKLAEKIKDISTAWNKEATLLRKDIRGFVTNRLNYAMYREAFYLVENGYASMEDVDRACRTVGGVWMAFCGPFRFMDLTGVQAYYRVMKDLFPTLSDYKDVPEFVEKIAQEGGNGISNGRGFYQYSEEEAKAWEEAFANFYYDIYALKEKHPPESLKKLT
ncbi:MAG: 3-hydroxyacyl-CoA dehydrogenase family protein [Saprospiraceae bacterium]|nr:3-hydroxyacyl-CoA dehydrogenase family protein [Saprospiraceae bacterium]